MSNAKTNFGMDVEADWEYDSANDSLSPAPHAGETSRGRKRPRNESNWSRNKRKLLRNSGESYVTSSKKRIPQKRIDPDFDCHCRKNCRENVNREDLSIFFSSFWNMGDFNKQNLFLRGLVKMSKVKRCRVRDGTRERKKSTFEYTVRVKEANIKVCKHFFLRALQISWGRLYRCLMKEEVLAVIDRRGKNPSKNKIDDSAVVAHIKSFPSYQSHYSRKDNEQRKFLNPDLNIRKMYDLYVQKCSDEKVEPVKEKFYYKVFSSQFNLHFKVPSKDTCRQCDELELQIRASVDEVKKSDLQNKKQEHLANAEFARSVLKEASQNATNKIYVATFDLQKALPFPKLSTSIAYYKRNLYVYNLGVHSFNSKIGYMHVWDETEGGRGSQDVASCLMKHLKANAAIHKSIILFSDACTGQNRNIKMALSLLKLAQDPNMAVETIDLKFMVSGHSFLPNDSEFGVIQSASRKKQHIFVPQDWYDIIRDAKRSKPRFELIEMKREEFMSTEALEKCTSNRKKDTAGHTVNWLQIRWLRFVKGQEFSIMFKETLSELVDFRQIDIKKRGIRGRALKSLQNVEQNILYVARRPITRDKKSDMNDLLRYIPPVHHYFFKHLPLPTATRAAVVPEDNEDNDEIIYD